MIGRTLGTYISIRFVNVLIGMVLGLGFLIVTVDFIEQLRKAASIADVPMWSLYAISLLRAPSFIERAFPFACLFAAMITLTRLNLKLELVVARAAGVSAWQFLLPICITAIAVGILVSTVYNPLSIYAMEKSRDVAASIFSSENELGGELTTRGYWVKQLDPNGGSTVINAAIARNEGQLLDGVKIIRLDDGGHIYQRIDARQAEFSDGNWALKDAVLTNSDGSKTVKSLTNLKTGLTKNELFGVSAKPENISFWDLLEVAKRVEKSGTNSKPYKVQFYNLLALPLFLCAMVLIAATVCLRFVRFGQIGRLILGGILTGFVLYTLSSLTIALGGSGVVPPVVAAGAPVFVAILFGVSVLLHQEDG